MTPGPTQLIIIAVIILLLFGATRLSEIGKGLGEGIRNFKKGLQDDESDSEVAEGTSKDKKKLPAGGKGADSESVEETEKEKA